MSELDGRADDEPRVARRTLIRGGAIVTGLGLAGGLTRDADAQGQCAPLLLGCANQSAAPTSLRFFGAGSGLAVQTQLPSATALIGASGPEEVLDPNDVQLGAGVYGFSHQGIGVREESITEVGVLGTSGIEHLDPNEPFLGAGVFGLSQDGVGVAGRSASDIGVLGAFGTQSYDPNEPNLGAGVYGVAHDGVGVHGRSRSEIGVLGTTGSDHPDPNEMDLGAGVYGLSTLVGSPGVLAEHGQGGVGLQVHGRTILSTAGRGMVPRGASNKRVVHPAVRSDSAVIVTLNGDPGLGTLRHVEVANGSFTVVLGALALRGAPFSYLVLN